MHHHVAVTVLEPRNNLLKKVPGLLLGQAPLFYNIVEKLSRLDVLHDDVDVHRSLDDFVQPNYVRVLK